MFLSVQLLSDLHLEFLDSETSFASINAPFIQRLQSLPVLAPVLILAGDIGIISDPPTSSEEVSNESIYQQFLRFVAAKWTHVLVVTGNHEYYGREIYETDSRIREFCKSVGSNLHFLQMNSVDIKGVRFLGATLWPKIPEAEAQRYEYVVNDYRRIMIRDPLLESNPDGSKTDASTTKGSKGADLYVAHTNRLHQQHLQYIQDAIAQSEQDKMPCVVITHHAPITRNVHEPSARDGATDIVHLDGCDETHVVQGKQHVLAWVFGHTHWSSSQVVHNTRFVSNQQGYAVLEESDGVFAADYVLRLTADLSDPEFTRRGHYEDAAGSPPPPPPPPPPNTITPVAARSTSVFGLCTLI